MDVIKPGMDILVVVNETLCTTDKPMPNFDCVLRKCSLCGIGELNKYKKEGTTDYYEWQRQKRGKIVIYIKLKCTGTGRES